MIDSMYIDESIDVLAEQLELTTLSPENEDELVLAINDAALTLDIGRTNVMSRIQRRLEERGRINPGRLQYMKRWFRERGVGTARPAVRCF